MIAAIVKKEFLTNLVSPRFVIGFILCFVLIPFSILINISNYRDRTAQYRLDRDAAETAMTEVRVYSTLRPEVVLPPALWSLCAEALSGQVAKRARRRPATMPSWAPVSRWTSATSRPSSF